MSNSTNQLIKWAIVLFIIDSASILYFWINFEWHYIVITLISYILFFLYTITVINAENNEN